MQGPVCQHGAEECLFNRVINCAEELNPGQDKWFPFVGCLEGSLQGNFQKDEAATRKCAEDAGVSYDTIKKCANGAHLSSGVSTVLQSDRCQKSVLIDICAISAHRPFCLCRQ